MDARDLRMFEAVALTGGMNRAAAELNTVQSNVTQRIKALELELGAQLFERSHRGVELTPAGRRLLPYARKVARLMDDARRAVSDEAGPLSGPLTIGSLETTAAIRLSPLLAKFSRANAGVDLTLRTGTTAELLEQVCAGALEGAFVCGPVGHADLAAETMFEEELVLLTAPGLSIDDIVAGSRGARRKLIVLRAGCSYRLMLEAWSARHGIVADGLLELGTLEAIVSCVEAGLGFTMLPRAVVGAMWSGKHVALHALDQGQASVETVFVRHRDGYASRALAAFLDLVRNPDRSEQVRPLAGYLEA